jgi:hypothetical protein
VLLSNDMLVGAYLQAGPHHGHKYRSIRIQQNGLSVD